MKPRKLPKYIPLEDWPALYGRATPSTLILLDFLLCSGCRISEALALTPADIDWERANGHSVMVRVRGKGNKERLIPVALDCVERLPQRLRNERFWPFTRQAAWERLRRIGVTPHILRHSVAVALRRGGADPIVVRDILGHASINTGMIYDSYGPHLDELRTCIVDALSTVRGRGPDPRRLRPTFNAGLRLR